MRAWLARLTATLPSQRLPHDGPPYMVRYFVAGWRPGLNDLIPAIYLHHFLASDPGEQVHSHPWPAVSLILAGAYREFRCEPIAGGERLAVRDYHPGEVNVLEVDTRHRIELLTPDAWSLLIRGPFVRDWMFAPACPP